jgi:hypothetical protein
VVATILVMDVVQQLTLAATKKKKDSKANEMWW